MINLNTFKLNLFIPGSDVQSSTNSTKQFPLNSSEELYSELRDKNFNAVGPTLSRKARIITSAMDEMRAGKSVQDLKAFVMEKIPQMKSLKQSVTTHTSIAELVKEKIDNPASLEFLQVEQELVNNQKVVTLCSKVGKVTQLCGKTAEYYWNTVCHF